MNNNLLNQEAVQDLKDTIKKYYGYTDNQLKEHWSKWKEVEVLQQQDMISHDDINDLITEAYKESYQLLNKKQKQLQTACFLEIVDSLVEPLLKIPTKKMKI